MVSRRASRSLGVLVVICAGLMVIGLSIPELYVGHWHQLFGSAHLISGSAALPCLLSCVFLPQDLVFTASSALRSWQAQSLSP